MLCMGIQTSNGLFFVELQDRFHVSASAVSTVGGTFSAIYSVGGWCWFSFVVDVVAVIVLSLLLLSC